MRAVKVSSLLPLSTVLLSAMTAVATVPGLVIAIDVDRLGRRCGELARDIVSLIAMEVLSLVAVEARVCGLAWACTTSGSADTNLRGTMMSWAFETRTHMIT